MYLTCPISCIMIHGYEIYSILFYCILLNTCLWSAFNVHEIMEASLSDQKHGIWCEISRSRVIGPIFNSDRYFKLILYPFIGYLNEDDIANRYICKAAPTLDTDMSRSDRTRLPDQISPGWCAYIDDRSCPAVWCHPLSVIEPKDSHTQTR
jgi:hypothetical protein